MIKKKKKIFLLRGSGLSLDLGEAGGEGVDPGMKYCSFSNLGQTGGGGFTVCSICDISPLRANLHTHKPRAGFHPQYVGTRRDLSEGG